MRKSEDYYTFNEYMKNNNLTPSEEDYIEMIYRLTMENDKVQVKDISTKLNIKPPSVTKMIKKLDNKKLLNYKKYDNIELTSLGIKESIHEETETIEHTINVETLIKIEELISFFNENPDVLSRLKNYQEKNKN